MSVFSSCSHCYGDASSNASFMTGFFGPIEAHNNLDGLINGVFSFDHDAWVDVFSFDHDALVDAFSFDCDDHSNDV